jgi:hypothetical protein
VAAPNLLKQLPLVEKEFPDIKGSYPGTMNVLLRAALRVYDPDFTTTSISWLLPGQSEKFNLTKINFECPIGMNYPAWIYDPHDSPHRFNDYLVEVISQKIPGVTYGMECQINLLRSKGVFGVVVV